MNSSPSSRTIASDSAVLSTGTLPAALSVAALSPVGGSHFCLPTVTPSRYPSPQSWGGPYSNPQMDDLLEKARTTTDNAKRKEYYIQIQQIIEDEVPIMFWYVKNNIEAVTDKIGGYKQSFTLRRMFLKDTTVG